MRGCSWLFVMSVYATLTSSPHRWTYVEATHFVSALSMTFEEYDQNVAELGRDRVDYYLLNHLQRDAASCPEARSPDDLLAAWHCIVAARRLPQPAQVTLKSFEMSPAVQPSPVQAPRPESAVYTDDDDSATHELHLSDDPHPDEQLNPVLPPVSVDADSSTPIAPAVLPGGLRPVGPEAVTALQNASLKGTKRQKLLLDDAADIQATQAAILAMEAKYLAANTWGSHNSQVKLYVQACMRACLAPFPMTHASLNMFGSLLNKHFGHASVPQYLQAVFRQQSLLEQPISEDLYKKRRFMSNAASRGAGDSHRMLPILFSMLAGIREFVFGVFHEFLFRIAVVTWFFVMRIDESLGSSSSRGLSESAFVFDYLHDDLNQRSVTVTLGITKANQQGLKCRRTHFCSCKPAAEQSDLDKRLPVCPFCAAWFLCHHNAEKDVKKPLRPVNGLKKPAPDSDHMLKFLRDMLEKFALKFPHFGLDLQTEEGRNLYGTQSLRRGAAQALIQAGWSIDDVKFFGRWLSDAIELYLLQVPMQSFGQRVAASMAGLPRIKKLQGADEDETSPGSFLPLKKMKKPAVGMGSILIFSFPDTLFESVHEDCIVHSPVAGSDLGDYAGRVAAMPPMPVPVNVLSRTVLFHDSVVLQHADDYRNFAARSLADRCVILDFFESDASQPLLYVCLQDFPFRLKSGVSSDSGHQPA